MWLFFTKDPFFLFPFGIGLVEGFADAEADANTEADDGGFKTAVRRAELILSDLLGTLLTTLLLTTLLLITLLLTTLLLTVSAFAT